MHDCTKVDQLRVYWSICLCVHLCFPIGTKTLLSTENVILQNQELSCIKKPSAMLN